MYRKVLYEDLPKEDTTIWSCEKEGCTGWIRDNFAFESAPLCHQCSSTMITSVKLLPTLVNSNRDIKALKKGIQIDA
ncbi:hypothetical protein SY83_16920 [Paenibacillus swuensis]|uniref:Cold-shock protein n=1 Tax=Paenibacillus swuensis TaxID=1178515 RepID=A0A172TKV3_9BACL|nr:cold-shock protein [Paenibacillus swuensis]ANE47685.1 hypothetical protein SY83_16920 [Paenibacillus swuensis]